MEVVKEEEHKVDAWVRSKTGLGLLTILCIVVVMLYLLYSVCAWPFQRDRCNCLSSQGLWAPSSLRSGMCVCPANSVWNNACIPCAGNQVAQPDNKCGCPSGMMLGSDGVTCVMPPPPLPPVVAPSTTSTPVAVPSAVAMVDTTDATL